MPKLSVIVPFHNVQEFAQDTLRSLARNARSDREFILVDDCSTDATPQIVDRAARTLPGARVIRHETNRGIARARNSGIDAARGDYLTFLDGDDWYAPGYLDDLIAAMDRYGTDFVRVDHVQSNGRDRVVRRAPARRRDTILAARDGIGQANLETMVDYPFVWAGIYHRRLFKDGAGRFAAELRTAEDRLWTWMLHLNAETFAVTGLLGVFYRRGVKTSLTQISDDRQLDFIPAHDAMLNAVLADPDADRFLPKAVRTYCALIAFHRGNSERLEPGLARRLERASAEALRRMPQDVLEETLRGMDEQRGRMLRQLRASGRGKPGQPGRQGTQDSTGKPERVA
ncbi:glycosyltransferase family 2 protein [Streptomyces sp. CMB-StM0423]|uniref:glycosyltransferase family 2 protein n=1 Tax=Streptomyces sp. CMB-StM0423 TaxID=2059884 RepID=UPI000C701A48|nr:glycosyltransferase family 2 protein [Streptomyces sp. CMB-StM0423]AUH42642.1 glycosyl transferase [Streptomyces sp. CMB-StM0423]